jgi:Holliday junction resolvase
MTRSRSAIGKRSKQKGAQGEREVAALMREFGFVARRGLQFKGTADSPDVEHNIPGFHVEVKYRRAMDFHRWLAQCEVEAGEGKAPLLFWRRDKTSWLVVLHADDFLRLAGEVADEVFAEAIGQGEEHD